MVKRIVSAAVVCSVVLVTAGVAQESRREGFWIGFGLGGGWNTSETLDGERLAGGAGYLRLGGSPSPNVLLGGDVMFWGRDIEGGTVSRGTTTFSVLAYPSSTGGFFFKGGVGGGWVNVRSTIAGIDVSVTEEGLGVEGGLGYDVRLSPAWSFTPAVDWLLQVFDRGGNNTDTNTLVLFTLGFVRH